MCKYFFSWLPPTTVSIRDRSEDVNSLRKFINELKSVKHRNRKEREIIWEIYWGNSFNFLHKPHDSFS